MATPAEIVAQYERLNLHDANEAETRLKVIDQILFRILGWSHSDVSVEERVSEDGSTTFADYVIRTGMTALVVEAKKAGATFKEIPNLRRARLQGEFLTGETGAAIIQARDYARKLSIPFAVVSNGSIWIVFPATRTDQVTFANSSAIIFPSLTSALKDDYAEFMDLLSRPAVISGSLEAALLGRIENQLEERRLNRFYITGFSRISRHSLFPLIEDAVTTAFSEDIVNADPDLLEKCYVKTPERTRFDARIQMHIAKREAVTSRPTLRPMRRDASAVSELIEAAAQKARPVAVLILGQVGAGKTTFLNYTRRVAAKDKFSPTSSKPYPHWIYIDFKDYVKSRPPHEFIMFGLREHMKLDLFLSDYERCIRPAYRTEIEALLRGPLFLLANDEGEVRRRIAAMLFDEYEKVAPYVERILGYVSTNAPVFMVIDNVDQHEDPATQSSIFADSVAIAHKLRLNLFFSLREATYVRHRSLPVFDAFDFDPISIDPPNVQAVLSRRFFVTRQMLSGKSAKFIAENGAEIRISDLSVIVEMVQASVLGTEIGNLIDVLATSDIRQALRMTREFLQSGYTASGRAVQIYQQTGHYVLPQHEALRAIMLGNQSVYSEEHSVIGNPFDARLSRTQAQLLRLYVLAALVQMSSDPTFQHADGTNIQKALREIGFGDDATLKVLSDLCGLRFIHTASHGAPHFEANFFPSRLGGHIVRRFIANMMFLENVMTDTFIADTAVWTELRRLTDQIYAVREPVARIQARAKRVEQFYQYMKDSYSPLRDESVRRGLSREWCTHPLEAAETELRNNLERAITSAIRNYGSADQRRAVESGLLEEEFDAEPLVAPGE